MYARGASTTLVDNLFNDSDALQIALRLVAQEFNISRSEGFANGQRLQTISDSDFLDYVS